MKLTKRWLKRKNKHNNSYLKYEEGEIIPVSPKGNYPPFLNEEENYEIKHFNSLKQDDTVINSSTEDDMKEHETSNNHGSDVKQQNSSNVPRKKNPLAFFNKVIWLIIIGGLIYYSIPLFAYFTSELPEISTPDYATEELVDNEDISGAVGVMKDTVTDTAAQAEDAIDAISSKGSGFVDKAKESLPTSERVLKQPSTEEQIVSLSNEQWLQFFSSIQNEKQQQLIALEHYTQLYTSGSLKHSQYRLKIKGVTNKIERLEKQLEETISNSDTAIVEPVVTALKDELTSLKRMSVSLSSVSERHIVANYNAGVDEQNQLTEAYKNAFKGLLDIFGKKYAEENGVIKYK